MTDGDGKFIIVFGEHFYAASSRARQLRAAEYVLRATGSKVEFDITFRCRTTLARWWVKLMRFVAPLLGRARAIDWALRGAKRLARVKIIGARPKKGGRVDHD